MPFSEVYRKQAALVVRALPEVAREDCFALKGGTGINLFIRDMPRLSVDIDLTYLPVQGREQSLAAIDAAIKRIEQGIKKSVRGRERRSDSSARKTSRQNYRCVPKACR